MTNPITPKKLLNSKWSALKPENREKHFLVTEVEFDENGQVTRCVIEAVISKREQLIDWQSLKDTTTWQQGWK